MKLTASEKYIIKTALKYAIENIQNGCDYYESKQKRIDEIKELITKIGK